MIPIDKNVPLPEKTGSGAQPHKPQKFPYADMVVGDSFVYDAYTKPKMILACNMNNRRGTNGRKFTCRKVREDGKDVIRVWRVK